MSQNKSELVRIQLKGSPYDSALHCPFCGSVIIWPGEEGLGECGHLVYSGMEEDPVESEDYEYQANDFCFEYFEAAPADRSHYFVFREPDEYLLDGDEDLGDEDSDEE